MEYRMTAIAVLANITLCFAADALPDVTAGFIPKDITQFFIEPGKPAAVYFSNSSAAEAPSCTVSDYAGGSIASLPLVRMDDGAYRLLLTLPRGYYELSMPGGRPFGIIALEPSSNTDPFFGLDTWMSWAEKRPELRTRLIQLIARTGISIARERINMGDVLSAPDTWAWNKDYRYDDIRTVYRENGIDVLEMLHGSPLHLRGKNKWPIDHAGAAVLYGRMREHFSGRWKAVEVQNEPDLKSQPGNFYPVQVKAVSYAFAAMRSSLPVIAGVTGTLPPSEWFTACGENGMLDDCDIFSYHDYESTLAAESLASRAREWLARYGHERMPLWHTESGWSWPAGTPRPERMSDAKSALEITGKAVEDRACGVARFFPFCMLYYIEGKKNFGMMGQEFTPLRSFAAYAYCISALSGKRYIGDLAIGDPSIKRARVFSDGSGTSTIVLYSGDRSNTASVPFSAPIISVRGIDGRVLSAAAGVPIPDGLCYIMVRTKEIAALLRTDTSAMRLFAIGMDPEKKPRIASPLVLQLSDGASPGRQSASKFSLSRDAARSLTLTVRIDNCSAQEMTVRGVLSLPGIDETVIREPMTVPSLGHAEISWGPIDVSRALDISEVRFLKVTADVVGNAVTPPSALAVPMLMDGSLEEHLARCRSVRLLPITDLSRWRKNTSSPGECSFRSTENGFIAELSFASGWAYPQFSLSEEFRKNDSGFLVRVRMAKKGSFVDFNARTRTLLFRKSDFVPADNEWHAVYIPFHELAPQGAGNQNTQCEPSQLTSIEVGLNTSTPNSIEVSHLSIIGK